VNNILGNGRNRDNYYGDNNGSNRNSSHKEREENPVAVVEPTCTLILRGFPLHTTSTTVVLLILSNLFENIIPNILPFIYTY
jgi:hypothetical protein